MQHLHNICNEFSDNANDKEGFKWSKMGLYIIIYDFLSFFFFTDNSG